MFWNSINHDVQKGLEAVITGNADEPFVVEDWDDRNLLYSLRFDFAAAILITGCNLRQV
jgi:hypothetical protein